MSSSTTTALSRQPLVQVLRNVADPRDRRGVRHDLPTVLSLAVAGVLAGARSLTAIWEHTTDLTGADLRSLGLEEGQALPSESTIRRVLQDLEPAGLDAHLASWLWTRTATINGRRVIAVDGKTMRGARVGEDPAPHLLAALDHATGAVLTQERVAGKTNEIPTLPELLEPLALDGVVVTADAMHTQVDTAQWITQRGGHYLLTVKDNQKTLRKTLKALPWKDVPSISSVDTSHGRRVRRTVKALEAPRWVDFPAAAQVLQVRRTRTTKGRDRRRLDPQALGHREPPPLGPRRGLRRGPPPAAHPQRTRDHGRPKKPGHQPHPPLPRARRLHRLNYQIPVQTPQTSHQTTDPTNPLKPTLPTPWGETAELAKIKGTMSVVLNHGVDDDETAEIFEGLNKMGTSPLRGAHGTAGMNSVVESMEDPARRFFNTSVAGGADEG